MEKLTDLSCTEFLDKLASDSPTPGGGGAAAIGGAVAVALASMVANLTLGKEKFAAVEAEIQEMRVQADCLRVELLDLVSQDAAAFGNFMACLKLPKTTEVERQARLDALQNAAKQAAAVPMQIARVSAQVMILAKRVTVIGNQNVVTDAICSVIMARAAVRCAIYNVYANLQLIKDEHFKETLRLEIAELDNMTAVAEQSVLAVTDKELS